jgi:hypothetical protein
MMSEEASGSRDELRRLRRVADQLCTAHAVLRDRYGRMALGLDLVILLSSAWLVALAFVDPAFNVWLVPLNLDGRLWIGLVAVATFCLTLVQLKVNWKRKSEAHARSFSMYAEVKREAGYLLATSEQIEAREFQRLAARYDMASDIGTGVPESEFLRLKRAHKLKVAVSTYLDEMPGASVWLTKLKFFFRDNMR